MRRSLIHSISTKVLPSNPLNHQRDWLLPLNQRRRKYWRVVQIRNCSLRHHHSPHNRIATVIRHHGKLLIGRNCERSILWVQEGARRGRLQEYRLNCRQHQVHLPPRDYIILITLHVDGWIPLLHRHAPLVANRTITVKKGRSFSQITVHAALCYLTACQALTRRQGCWGKATKKMQA